MDDELKQYLVAMEQRFMQRVEQTEQRIEQTGTKLLTAFHGWARSMEVRSRGVMTMVSGFDERLTFIEDRLSELERRSSK